MLSLISGKLWIYAAIAIAVVGVLGKVRYDGIQAERARVERQNNEARAAAVEGARDVQSCFDADGVWDRSIGKCTARGH